MGLVDFLLGLILICLFYTLTLSVFFFIVYFFSSDDACDTETNGLSSGGSDSFADAIIWADVGNS